MPIIGRDAKGRPRLIKKLEQISRMSMPDLIAMEEFLWHCMDEKMQRHHAIPHPSIVDTLNAIHREVEWRAQDPFFK